MEHVRLISPNEEAQRLLEPVADRPERRPYTPPSLEPIGRWSSLTLQQSIPIWFFYEFE
jgi:hypothetical protein